MSRSVAESINKIRVKAGNPLATCPTCGHVPEWPYVRKVGPVIQEGCIDACHVDAMLPGYRAWFDRPRARDHRARELATLRGLSRG